MRVEDLALYLQAHPELLEYGSGIIARFPGDNGVEEAEAKIIGLRLERDKKLRLVLDMKPDTAFRTEEDTENEKRVKLATIQAKQLLVHVANEVMGTEAAACVEALREALDIDPE
jgi:hypothetical protein